MKQKNALIIAAVVFTASLHLCSATLPAKLPEFKSKAELQTTQKSHAVTTGSEKGIFYTGKPFETARDGYLFKYRNYDPELNRWTSIDPSGFLDGANGNIYVGNGTTSDLDPNGLWKVKLVSITPQGGSWSPASGNWDTDINHTRTLSASGGLSSDTQTGQLVDSISITGSGRAKVNAHNHLLNTDSTVAEITSFTPTYTVNVNSDGYISISGGGDNKTFDGSLMLLVNANYSGPENHHSLSLTVGYSAVYAPQQVTGAGGNIMGTGGNFAWTSSTKEIAGSVSMYFEAVE